MGATLLLATALLAIPAAFTAPSEMPTGEALVSLVVLGLVCTALALVVFSFLIVEVGPGRALVITYINPVVAVVLGVAILGESLGPGAIAGLLLILAGSWLSTDGRLPPGLRRAGGGDAMSRVLVTGGAGTIGAAVVRRLLRDPDFEVRVSDQREAPIWMREGCEVHRGDLRALDEARKAMRGCTHVIHLAAIVGGIANFHKLPHTLTEVNNALYNAVFRAALDEDVERFTYVSSSMVFEQRRRSTRRARTTCRTARCRRSAYGFSQAHRRGLLPRRARRARPAVHDLPPVQRLRAGRDARGRAGHRARRAGPDPQVAAAPAPAADLRHRRAHAHADARRRHRRRDRRRDRQPRRA